MLGIFSPESYVAVLLVQLIYKTFWLSAAAFLSIAKGNRSPGLVFLTVLFSIWVVALVATIPFNELG